MNAPTTTHHYDSIDILRGFAAISVVVYHIIEHFKWESFPVSGPLVWFRIGWIGVDLFFVISGLVIGLSAFSAIDRYGRDGFRSYFFARRLARIVPLHYLTLAVFVILVSPELIFNHLFANLAAHLLFVHNLSPDLHGAINGANWSLGVEMQFYVLMLILSPWLIGCRWWVIAASFFSIAWLWRFGVSQLVPLSDSLGPFPVFVAATQLPGTLDQFAVGIVLAVLARSGRLQSLKRPVGTGLLVLATVGVLAACFSWFWAGAASYWTSPIMMVIWRSFLGVALGAVVLCAMMIEFKGVLRRLLSPLYYLGTISYGIYLWHLPVLMSLKRVTWLSQVQVLWVGIGATLVLSVISWHFFEIHFTKASPKRGPWQWKKSRVVPS